METMLKTYTRQKDGYKVALKSHIIYVSMLLDVFRQPIS